MALEQEIELTRELCAGALGEPQLGEAARFLRTRGIAGERARSLLTETFEQRHAAAELLALRQEALQSGVPSEGCLVERAFLLEQAIDALDRVLPSLPAVESVRRLWCKDIETIAAPPSGLLGSLALEGRFFVDLCKVIAGKRFPTGQHHWEEAGFPRSWLLKPPPSQFPRLASFLLFSMRGFRPFLETHLRFMPPGAPLLKRAFVAAFHRMASSLGYQPHIRGLMASSWLYSAETARVAPHLGFFRELFQEAGGALIDLGPASERDGFLEGSAQRAELYGKGEYRPTVTIALCSREQAVAWAKRHPEAEQLANNIRV